MPAWQSGRPVERRTAARQPPYEPIREIIAEGKATPGGPSDKAATIEKGLNIRKAQQSGFDFQKATGTDGTTVFWGEQPGSGIVVNGKTSTFNYDPVGQLIQALRTNGPDETFSWDANGNPNGPSYVIGRANQLLLDGAYDVFDRRLTQSVDLDGAGAQLAQKTLYVYDRVNTWADFDAAGTVVARYLLGAKVDELLVVPENAKQAVDGWETWSRSSWRSGTDAEERLENMVLRVSHSEFARSARGGALG